jgi:hypothetical protein
MKRLRFVQVEKASVCSRRPHRRGECRIVIPSKQRLLLTGALSVSKINQLKKTVPPSRPSKMARSITFALLALFGIVTTNGVAARKLLAV